MALDGIGGFMRKPVILITGASGEIGHGLIENLAASGDTSIITIDLQPLPKEHRDMVDREYLGSILEIHLLERILAEFEVRTIYHLAALLSTRTEFTPLAGHQVNVEGTLKLLDFAQSQGESHGRPVVFLYPSSIAAYGLPDLETKKRRKPPAGVRVEPADHHVRLQQALLRTPRPATTPPTTSSSPPRPSRARSTSVRSAFRVSSPRSRFPRAGPRTTHPR